jgi:hypothetical protein
MPDSETAVVFGILGVLGKANNLDQTPVLDDIAGMPLNALCTKSAGAWYRQRV